MAKKLRILLDSDSLKSDSAQRLLAYRDCELFDFVSIGESKLHTELEINLHQSGNGGSIVIDKLSKNNGCKESIAFHHDAQDAREVSKLLGIKYEDLMPVYVLECLLSTSERIAILVTERESLLMPQKQGINAFFEIRKNRILNVRDASIFIDLYCKGKRKFFVAPSFTCNKGMWYRESLKTKVPNFQKTWTSCVFAEKTQQNNDRVEVIESLGDRVTDMLIAIDEMGTQYYRAVNNDTQDGVIYHFNYWITLFTGILDSLAWAAKITYTIKTSNFQDIGLRKEANKSFLENIADSNQLLADLIERNEKLILLMYKPRDLVIHRVRLKGVAYEDNSENIKLNAVRISKDFFDKIADIATYLGGDWNHDWGCYEVSDEIRLLEPYSFAKKVTPVLLKFVDDFLKDLDLKLPMRAKEHNVSTKLYLGNSITEAFKKSHLGY